MHLSSKQYMDKLNLKIIVISILNYYEKEVLSILTLEKKLSILPTQPV